MGIFEFIFGKKKNTVKAEQSESGNVTGEIIQAPAQYRDVASQNKDIVQGMQFHATCQLCTPIDALKKHGEVFKGYGEPPIYGTSKDGIWVPKVDSDYNFLM